MNGFIKKTVASLCLGGSLATLAGCLKYKELVDPCYPERYSSQSREAVHDFKDVQAAQGHKLDQTVWHYHFETETDLKTGEPVPTAKLHPLGIQHLDYLARRRPHPDPKVYLQTSGIDKLDWERQDVVLKYLNKKVAFIQPGFVFETPERIDPASIGLAAAPIGTVINQMYSGFKGTPSSK
jgi:hypothetical protein